MRQARLGRVPDPVEAARSCERAGADSIVCHLREDRRHIQDADVARLLNTLSIPLNLEMSIAPDVVEVAMKLKPRQVTLVPERRRELTTEGGLDVVQLRTQLQRLVPAFQKRGIAVSLFVDPIESQLRASAQTGAQVVELHTGQYAGARTASARKHELIILRRAADQAARLGLGVAAGHGLDYDTTAAVAAIPAIQELNIGFSIIARSVFVGLEQAVREMKTVMKRS